MSRPRSQGIIGILLIGTLALIAYGSLYPFDLRPGSESIALWRALGHLTWARAGRSDRIANVLLYVPLGFCLFRWLETRLRRNAAAIIAVGACALLSYCIEVAQVYIESRVASYWDVALNVVGGIIGAAAGIAWHELTVRLNIDAARRSGRPDRSAMFILLLWLVWRLWPFIPQFNIGTLKAAFRPLADPFFSTAATLHFLIWWTLLAHIVFELIGGQRGIEALLALIAVVLVGCLFVTHHGFVASELLALVLLLPTLLVFNRLTPTPRRWLLVSAFAALLFYDSLAPFGGPVSSGYFDAWPFLAWIDAGFPIDWQWLARRACYFAAFAWVLKQAGMRSQIVTIFAPIVVLAMELLRASLFGLDGSLTEPLLALLIAWIMQRLDGARSASLRRVRSH